MTLAKYVQILGRGPGRSRDLTREEARAAMTLVLSGEAAPEAVGALLMLMRFRGETAPEIAGFVDAVHGQLGDWTTVGGALDWPTYAAGRTRGEPFFLLAAKLVAQNGHSVVLHGWNSHQNERASIAKAVPSLGIPTVETPDAARAALAEHNIAYIPLETLSKPAYDVLRLRDVLGLRSCFNTVLRMMNPTNATAAVQGVFHPSYRDLQSDAGALLGRETITVIKGGGGEFERHPGKGTAAYGLANGALIDETASPMIDATRKLHELSEPVIDLAALWRGDVDAPFATSVVVATAGLAFWSLGAAPTIAAGDEMAQNAWANRDTSQ